MVSIEIENSNKPPPTQSVVFLLWPDYYKCLSTKERVCSKEYLKHKVKYGVVRVHYNNTRFGHFVFEYHDAMR